MNNNNIIPLKQPEENSLDGLTELLRNGAKELISQAVNAELEELLAHHSEKKAGSRYFCESLFWASQPKQTAKT